MIHALRFSILVRCFTTACVLLALALGPLGAQSEDEGQEQKTGGVKVKEKGELIEEPVKTEKGPVTVRGGAHIVVDEEDYKPCISVGLSGPTEGCCWVQFVWRELVQTKADGSREPIPGLVMSSAGSYRLTVNPAQKRYAVDSPSKTNPCHGADDGKGRFPVTRTATDLTFYDKPGSVLWKADRAMKDPKTTRVESIGHYDSFLVCEGKIIIKVSWTATYTWNSGDSAEFEDIEAIEPEFNVDEMDTTDPDLDDGQKEELKEEYPDQTVLPVK